MPQGVSGIGVQLLYYERDLVSADTGRVIHLRLEHDR
jgi:hypothetical protein